MKYALFILPRAQREIASLSKIERERIQRAVIAFRKIRGLLTARS